VQKVTNRNIYDVSTILEREIEEDGEGVGDEEEDNECDEGNAPVQQGNNVDSTSLRRDDVEPITIDEVYVHLDESIFFKDDFSNEGYETSFDDEQDPDDESMFLNDDSIYEEELSCNSDIDSDDDMCILL
jgi:hypothetical protein